MLRRLTAWTSLSPSSERWRSNTGAMPADAGRSGPRRAIVSPTGAEGRGNGNRAHPLLYVGWTGAPCTKKDTADTQGKNGEAGTRQIRVALFGEYGWLDKKGRPSPFRGSFSYAVSGEEIAEVSRLVRKLGGPGVWEGGADAMRRGRGGGP